jgi:hypothetical protein
MPTRLSTLGRQILTELYRRGCVATVADIADGLGIPPAEVDEMLSAAELRHYTRRARVYAQDGAVLTILAEDWCEQQDITPSAWLPLPGLDDAGHVHLSDRAAKRLTRDVMAERRLASV